MIGTFLFGVVAGWGAPHAEPRIKAALDGILFKDAPVTPQEMSLISLATCLLGAAILSMIVSTPHAVPLAFGAALGVFGPKLIAKWQASKTPDYDA